jgi:hypothetical protein
VAASEPSDLALAGIARRIWQQGDYELVAWSEASGDAESSYWRGRDLRSSGPVRESLRASSGLSPRHRIVVVDALDEMPAEDDDSLSSMVFDLVDTITRESPELCRSSLPHARLDLAAET